MKTKQQYLWNALLLTAVTLLMRTVSVGFNVYVSNREVPRLWGFCRWSEVFTALP